jgi:hypothetical protein
MGEFISSNGKGIRLMDVSMHVTDGSYGINATYVVENESHSLWQLKPVDYNTTF